MPQLKVGVFTLKRHHVFHPEDAGILAFLLCHGAEVWRISTLPHYATVSWRNLVKSITVIPECAHQKDVEIAPPFLEDQS